MDRETKKFKTKNGHEIEIVTYATGREVRGIEGKYFKKMKVDLVGGQPSLSDVDMTAQYEVEQEMIRLLVKSVDGKTEDIVNTVLDLRSEDYEEIIVELNEVTKKK